MKLKILSVAALLISFAACKTPYKATDTSTPVTDNSRSMTDTSILSGGNKTLRTDSIEVASKIDSIRMLSKSDSSKKMTATDSTRMPSAIDSSNKLPSPVDSSNKTSSTVEATKMQPAMDSTKMRSATDSSTSSLTGKSGVENVKVAESIKTALAAQYPGATNIAWSNFDSLAAVPIDLRMAGWKKMNGDDYLVTFDLDNENYYAWYGSDGDWIGSAYTMKDFTKLPAAVNTSIKNAIKARYQDYNITNVNREFQKNKKSYEVELKNADSKVKMLVNADGKITQVFKYVKDKN